MDNYIGFVYIWTNKINEKKYIGAHIGKIDDGYIGSGVLFKKAIEKYGIENFSREILYIEYECIENLFLKEMEIINHFDAVNSDSYYNLTNYDPKYIPKLASNLTRKHTEESKRKLSEAKKGTKIPLHVKEKMSKAQKGRKLNRDISNSNNPFYGKKHSEETKKIIKEKCKPKYGKDNPFYGKKHSEETKKILREKCKPKYGKDNPASIEIEIHGIKFESLKSAAEYFDMDYSSFYRKYRKGKIDEIKKKDPSS